MSTEIPVFVINLDQDTRRLASISAQLDKQATAFERFPAVNRCNLPAVVKPYFDSAQCRNVLTEGEIGCYASHLSLHHKIVSEIKKTSLILEDDVEIASDIAILLQQIKGLTVDWDIIRLSNTPKRAVTVVTNLHHRYALVKYSKIPLSTGAYLITPAGAEKFLYWRQLRQRPIDQDMRRPWECGLNTYGVTPPPIRPDIFDSTIDRLGRNMSRKRQKNYTMRSLMDPIREFLYNIKFLGILKWSQLFYTNILRSFKRRFISAPI